MMNQPRSINSVVTERQHIETMASRYLPMIGQLAPPALVERGATLLLNHLLSPSLQRNALSELSGRWLAIDCSDWPYPIRLSCHGERLLVSVARGPVDASIRGDAHSFLALLRQDCDPDTLFFQRKLVMQGDTELALAVKNFLDTVDPVLIPIWLQRLIGKR